MIGELNPRIYVLSAWQCRLQATGPTSLTTMPVSGTPTVRSAVAASWPGILASAVLGTLRPGHP
jgi:hypothetical protein